MGVVALWAVSLVYIFGAGAIAGKMRPHEVEWPMQLVGALVSNLPRSEVTFCTDDEVLCGENDVSARREVPCAPFATDNARHAVLFTFGQSNAANEGRDRYLAGDAVANFNPFDGKCYIAQDPLLGAYGPAGSVWGRVGDQLIAEGLFDRVLIIAIGVGGSSIARWTQEGDLNTRIGFALDGLARHGIEPTHILWHQGEADRALGTARAAYVDAFGSIVDTFRNRGVVAPLYPAIATYCYMFDLAHMDDYAEETKAIRAAQQSLPDEFAGVLPGPDPDQITGPAYRHDNCHFTHLGMRRHAALWVKSMRAAHGAD